MDKLTIAGSSGLVWLSLISHFGAGLIGLVSGFIALVVAKGGKAHKTSGMVFACAMVGSALMASGIAAYEGKSELVFAGLFVGYLVYTAVITVRPIEGHTRRIDVILMILAFTLAAKNFWGGWQVWQLPGHQWEGVPAAIVFLTAIVWLSAAIGDLRMIRAGGIQGTRRIARHLWRLCYAFFIATGSFFIGQMKFVPAPIRILPLMLALGVAPLFVMLYWLWRVRLRKKLKGIILAAPAAEVRRSF